MEFLLLIYEDENRLERLSPEALEAQQDDYRAYTKKLIDAGVFKGGNALQATVEAACARDRNGEVLTFDGPFAETKEQFGGYYHIDCADMETALHWAGKMPAARTGTVEVRPIWNY